MGQPQRDQILVIDPKLLRDAVDFALFFNRDRLVDGRQLEEAPAAFVPAE